MTPAVSTHEDRELIDLPATLEEAIEYFSAATKSVAYMASRRWKDGIVRCPSCGSSAVTYLSSRQIWECNGTHSRLQFSVRAGTMFEASHISLNDWLVGIWMLAVADRKVSSYEVAGKLKITQKSAWLMLRRIKFAMNLKMVPEHPAFKALAAIDIS